MLLQGVQKNRDSYVYLLEQTWGSPAILLPPDVSLSSLESYSSAAAAAVPLLIVSSSIRGYLFINK